jgi:hypothetical protein
VPREKCRYDVGVEVRGDTSAAGEVSINTFPPCLIAEVEIKGTVEVGLRALHWLDLT